VPPSVPGQLMQRLLLHEAMVHAMPGRELRDLGDSLLLLDAADAEPFWNRLEAVRWPEETAAFDRRLAEVAVLFASLGRQPHIWISPSHDTPADLAERLLANGFEDSGPGYLMVCRDADAAQVVVEAGRAAGAWVERWSASLGAVPSRLAGEIVDTLLAAFGINADRDGLLRETNASLADRRFTHYLVRDADEPVAVARAATFDGLTYLSSIGTIEGMRGHGLGRLVTATAQLDGLLAGSDWVHLGVYAENHHALRLYRGLGFVESGAAGPDMEFVG